MGMHLQPKFDNDQLTAILATRLVLSADGRKGIDRDRVIEQPKPMTLKQRRKLLRRAK